jgi:hypothetical protein
MKQDPIAVIFGITIVASSNFLGKANTDITKSDVEIRETVLG